MNLQTIHYYERRGLLPKPPRTESNYRAYPPDAVLRVRFIKRAQELGFSLKDIKELLSLRVTAFVYTAAYEGRLAAENALDGNSRKRDYTALPWVVFTDPQVAGVGLDEKDAATQGIEIDSARLDLGHVPRALAARDTRGFIKLIKKRGGDELLGARVLAPEGGEQIMEAALAIRHGIGVSDLAAAFHPYLTQSEGIKFCAQAFKKDVRKLSCCST